MVRRLLSLAVVLLSFSPAFGKDLTSRLGIGGKNNTAFNLPSLAAVYYPSPDFGVTGGLGIDTQKDESRFTVNGGVRRILFREDHMNFYFGGQLGLVNYEAGGDKQSGFELTAVSGGEFFLPGLESLGFTFEAGVGVTSMRNTRFRTISDDPIRAGIIFYF